MESIYWWTNYCFSFAGIGLFKQIDAKNTNKEREDAAYKQAVANKEKLEKQYANNNVELDKLKKQLTAKQTECSSLKMDDPNWYQKSTACQSEESELRSNISDIEMEQSRIENYDNTVFYDKVKPMSYLIFYIIGGSILGLAILGGFIIYLVKGKKTYE